MAVPPEILAVERPKNTRVKQSGSRFLVIKRTCKRIDGRNVPVELGTIGEIVDGRYVEKRSEPRPKGVDIKDYGEVALCSSCADELLPELAKVWDIADAKRLYAIAVLRAAYGDVKNRDLQMQYETSYMSEMIPGLHMSENTVSKFLQEIGKAYSFISEFMTNRVKAFAGRRIVIDGMLKDYNSDTGSMSEFSRKGRIKGSRDISLMYAYDIEKMEPIAAKPYPGNMLDQSAIHDFVDEYKINSGMLILDKGFLSEAFIDNAESQDGLSYVIPLKKDSALIARYGMDNPKEHLSGFKERVILYKKERMSNGKYLYAFRDPKEAYEQEVGYVQHAAKKESYDSEKYCDRKSQFGLIVFRSSADLDPLAVYSAYADRWDIEVMFNMYKNIIDRDTVNVHGDYSMYATEFINFLSVLIASRVKMRINGAKLNEKYSYKQIFKYLSKYKKVKVGDKKWQSATMLKYIQETATLLGI